MTHCLRRNSVVAFESDQVPTVVHPLGPLLADCSGCSYFVPARMADPSSLPTLWCGRQRRARTELDHHHAPGITTT
jgi:hypothetical protein